MKYELIVAAEAREQLWETANWYRERSGSIELAVAWHDGTGLFPRSNDVDSQ